MPLLEVERLLGPIDPDGRFRPSPKKFFHHLWDDLELMIFQGTVHNMAVPLQRTSVSLPFAVCGWQEPQPADLPYERVIAELATAGVVWNSAPEVVLDDDALGLRMAGTNVGMLFAPDLDRTDHLRLWRVWSEKAIE
ncbi:hypothetical protein [Actinomadura madurae]|uniref:hypothetical protein n=1 Tax=Actinomadura madurae TaxID=1993 RepID=UPI002026AB43|nr:hypothetical protein [Actinomadura madurae]MCP9952821.1 hypothetical protein [Actinomadura madurae]MCP9969584.1 hypothetical protein [Actinomadura madurae]MCP9982043.1 hypothetical protein [Actinomadura madurae]MCQ0006432.1 hypothetical protein [Actinomadura madurae]MCQ0018279.1 hypothetical protein [Actinomadura madurae]